MAAKHGLQPRSGRSRAPETYAVLLSRCSTQRADMGSRPRRIAWSPPRMEDTAGMFSWERRVNWGHLRSGALSLAGWLTRTAASTRRRMVRIGTINGSLHYRPVSDGAKA